MDHVDNTALIRGGIVKSSGVWADFLDWPYLDQVFQLERIFTDIKSGATNSHIVYGFTSLPREQVCPVLLLRIF